MVHKYLSCAWSVFGGIYAAKHRPFFIIECISRPIKVTDFNNARWKLDIKLKWNESFTVHQGNQSDKLNVFWTSRYLHANLLKFLSYCIKKGAKSECCTARQFNHKIYFHSRVRLFESQLQHRLSFSDCSNSLEVNTGVVPDWTDWTDSAAAKNLSNFTVAYWHLRKINHCQHTVLLAYP
jgi:hypothetical protein